MMMMMILKSPRRSRAVPIMLATEKDRQPAKRRSSNLCESFVPHLPHELGHLLSAKQNRPDQQFAVRILEHAAGRRGGC